MTAPPPAKPRYITPRAGLRTLGGKADRVATLMGGGFRRWQRQAADVALEVTAAGQWRYRRVLVSVPRQSGKTNQAAKVAVHRALIAPGSMIWLSAQTGAAARERFIKEIAQPCEKSINALIDVKYGAGDTRLVVRGSGSQIRPMPPTAQYLHGEQSDLVVCDEAWALSPAAGAAYLQAVLPTQFSRPNPQLWFLSTAGDAGSSFWHDMLAAGCEQSDTCVIDWGVPCGEDPTDVETVIRHHPLNQSAQVRDKIREAADVMDPTEFARAYGNVQSAARSSIVSPQNVAAATTDAPLDDAPIALGIAVSVDQSETAIVAVGAIEGVAAIEVIACRPGQSWVAAAVRKITAEHQVISVAMDSHGPGLTLSERLATEQLHGLISGADGIRIISTEDFVAGTELFMTGLESSPPVIRLRRNALLADEIGGAVLRTLGDRGRVLSRSRSLTPVPRLEAAILALREYVRPRSCASEPMVWSPT